MEFTFGIITTQNREPELNIIIDSIESNNIPKDKYEIIIVGNVSIERENTKVIPFDDTVRHNWITKKKNLITLNSTKTNIVFSHDYYYFADNWYSEFLKYGDDFNVCMNQILNLNGERYRDWTLWPHNFDEEPVNFRVRPLMNYPIYKRDGIGCLINQIVCGLNNEKRNCLLPYNVTSLSKYMYISGGYWVAKRDIMNKYMLDENFCWGDGEDLEWSMRIRNDMDFSMNENSIVKLLKQKDRVFNELNQEDVNVILSYIR